MTTVVIMTSYKDVLRSNIKAELARRDWKGQQAAQRIGLTPAMFSSRLHGRTEWRMNELVALADALAIPFSRLLSGIDDVQATTVGSAEVTV